MGVPVKLGEKIPLSLQLTDEITDAFVEAELTDATKTPLGASPVELVHDSLGHYTNNAVDFPTTERVFAILRVFTDNTKTKRHPRHRNTLEDIFPRDEFNAIVAKIPSDFVATIEESELITEIESDVEQTAEIVANGEQTATVEEKELVATIDEDEETLIATTEC